MSSCEPPMMSLPLAGGANKINRLFTYHRAATSRTVGRAMAAVEKHRHAARRLRPIICVRFECWTVSVRFSSETSSFLAGIMRFSMSSQPTRRQRARRSRSMLVGANQRSVSSWGSFGVSANQIGRPHRFAGEHFARCFVASGQLGSRPHSATAHKRGYANGNSHTRASERADD